MTPAPSFVMLRPHLRAAHDLIPLRRWDEGGKAPQDRGWTTANYSSFDFAAHMAIGGNVGNRLRSTDLIIDVDPRHFAFGDDPVARLAVDLGLDVAGWPFVQTGGAPISGHRGRHYYLTKPPHFRITTKLTGYSGVEFKTAGTQVVAAGSVHPETATHYAVDPISRHRRRHNCSRRSTPGLTTPQQRLPRTSSTRQTLRGCWRALTRQPSSITTAGCR